MFPLIDINDSNLEKKTADKDNKPWLLYFGLFALIAVATIILGPFKKKELKKIEQLPKELIEYVEEQLSKNIHEKHIRTALSKSGWHKDHIEKVFTHINNKRKH